MVFKTLSLNAVFLGDRKKAQDWLGDTSNFGCQEDEENLAKKTEILGEQENMVS